MNEPPQPKRWFRQICGRKVELAWFGPGPDVAPTIVFLHDGLGCIDTWRRFPHDLASATGCGALLYSRHGYGRSAACDLPRSINFVHDEAYLVLPEILLATEVRRFALVGHSDGGSIALLHAMKPSSGLCGVATIAPHVFFEPLCRPALEKARNAFEHDDLRRKLALFHGSNTAVAFYGWNNAWLDPKFASWDVRDELSQIQVPVLVVQGHRDPFGSVAQLKAIADNVSGTCRLLLLENVEHAPHLEQTDKTLPTMATFVSECLTGKFEPP